MLSTLLVHTPGRRASVLESISLLINAWRTVSTIFGCVNLHETYRSSFLSFSVTGTNSIVFQKDNFLSYVHVFSIGLIWYIFGFRYHLSFFLLCSFVVNILLYLNYSRVLNPLLLVKSRAARISSMSSSWFVILFSVTLGSICTCWP